MTKILEAKALTKVFFGRSKKDRQTVAVDHISFQLQKGEILGLVGESGSGKSTVAKLLTRLIDPTEGNLILNGADITKAKGKQLREIYRTVQMVFQNPTGSFDPRKSLGDGIGERLRIEGKKKSEAREDVVRLLGLCGLSEEYADRYPTEVSGGQCQRAAIARALIGSPEVLILDEATSALDVTVQKQIIELLEDLKEKRGLSYLFICHNLALVQQFCDRVLVMHDGKIVEEGLPDQVILHPQDEYTKELVDAILGMKY